MDAILSWSGAQSRKVAEALSDWLKHLLPGVKVWLSSDDIAAGSSWFSALLGRLEAAQLCIICVTPENVRSPWLYFEAGAVAGRSTRTRICPYLVGIEGSQIPNGPLSIFQWASAEMGSTWKLLREINRHLQSGVVAEPLLAATFEQTWPELKRRLEAILAEHKDVTIQEVPKEDALRAIYQLGKEAISLLVQAAKDSRGVVFFARTMHGTHIQTNGQELADPTDARSVAIWQGAIRQLLHQGLLETRGSKGEVFAVTAEGYRVADEIRSKGKSVIAEVKDK